MTTRLTSTPLRPSALRAVLVASILPLLAACGDADDGDAAAPPAAGIQPPPAVEVIPPLVEPVATAAAPPLGDAAPVAVPAPEPPPQGAAAVPATTQPQPLPPVTETPAAAPNAPEIPATPATPAMVDPAPAAETDPALAQRLAAADPEAGRVLAARCGTCHAFAADAPAGNGPNLFGIVGDPVGMEPGYAYSAALAALAATGAMWTFDRLDAFLENPAVAVPGTRMGFGGIPDEAQRADLIAHLRTLAVDPVPLPGAAEERSFRAEIMALGLGPATFTIEQVQVGRDTYSRSCSTCHGAGLQGIWHGSEWGEAPALAGERFERIWFLRSLGDFVSAMETTDIIAYASLHAGLSPAGYSAVAAYLLSEYGFAAGEFPLPVDQASLRGIGFWQ